MCYTESTMPFGMDLRDRRLKSVSRSILKLFLHFDSSIANFIKLLHVSMRYKTPFKVPACPIKPWPVSRICYERYREHPIILERIAYMDENTDKISAPPEPLKLEKHAYEKQIDIQTNHGALLAHRSTRTDGKWLTFSYLFQSDFLESVSLFFHRRACFLSCKLNEVNHC